MDTYIQDPDTEQPPKDISQEFLSLPSHEFHQFLRSQKGESALTITIDWVDVPTARKLKAFLEDSRSALSGQKRSATIRATEEQHNQEMNVFASGVKWEKV